MLATLLKVLLLYDFSVFFWSVKKKKVICLVWLSAFSVPLVKCFFKTSFEKSISNQHMLHYLVYSQKY